jgi:hypothetical protein
MDVLRSAVSLLAHWEPETANGSHDANVRKAERLLAQVPVIVAARRRLKSGQQPVASDPALTLPANFLWMLRGQKPSEKQVQAMDVSLILYAEHEFNASTFSARCVVSTLSDLHSGIVAGIGALKGPLHGGANEAAMSVLEEVGAADRAEAWIRKALVEKRKIMGFGHRVYKDGDPRAIYLKKLTAAVAVETGHQDMEKMANIIESIVWNEKKIPPNVDWPCARLYHYFGLPPDLYTPIFVVARVIGFHRSNAVHDSGEQGHGGDDEKRKQDWIVDGKSSAKCAAFCRDAVLTFVNELPIVTKAAQILQEGPYSLEPERVNSIQSDLATALIEAKSAPRIRAGYPPPLNDTAWVRLEYVVCGLKAVEAALQLQPLTMLREIWEARQSEIRERG